MSSSGNEEDDEQRTIERRNEKVPSPRNCPSEEEEEEEEEECVFLDEKTMRFEKDSQERGEEEEEGEEKAARILSRELFAGTMLFAVFARARTLCDVDVSISFGKFLEHLCISSLFCYYLVGMVLYCTIYTSKRAHSIDSALYPEATRLRSRSFPKKIKLWI